MPQPLGEWLTNEYGADLSAVTEISGVPNDVTGSLDPLANCTKLETLNLAYSEALTGSLDVLANCTALVTLNLYRCRGITGPCPRPAASKSPT